MVIAVNLLLRPLVQRINRQPMEQIVGRLSLEPSVTAARWRVESSIE